MMNYLNRYDPYSRSSSSSNIQLKSKEAKLLHQLPYTHTPLESYPIPQIQTNNHGKSHPHPSQPNKHVRSSSQSSGRYQPSRGAQRDAKYTKKEAEKKAEPSLAQVKLQATIHSGRTSSTSSYPHSKPIPGRSQPIAIEKARNQLPLIDPTYNKHVAEPVHADRIRREQLAAIHAAREAHLEARRMKEEEDKKIRRIQLQVFVHARPTQCEWHNCQAVLNSWATLEKHIHHSHLHPSWSTSGPTKCGWKGCHEVLKNRDACERHVLVDHMGDYSARCPFNCLFEGPSFSSLMAHIGRRHPNATPDDFIPGLIHQKPTLPPLSALPKLPSLDHPNRFHAFNPIKPFQGGIGNRNRKMVSRSCFKGKHPRVDAYEDKRGAGAAIQAIIENSKRLKSIPPNSAIGIKVKVEGIDKIGNLKSEELEPNDLARPMVELVDVLGSAKFATEKAKEELGSQSEGSDYGSIPSEPMYFSQPSSPEVMDTIGQTSAKKVVLPQRPRLERIKRSERLRLKIVERRNSDTSSSFTDSLYSEES